MRLVTLDSREVGGRPAVSLPSGEILDLLAASATLGTSQWRPQSVVSVLAQGEEGAAHVGRLIAEKTEIPAGVVNIVASSDHALGEMLAADPRVDGVTFTGSTATGRRVLDRKSVA